jgi:hypothetical protein
MGCCFSREDKTSTTPVKHNEKNANLVSINKGQLYSPEKRTYVTNLEDHDLDQKEKLYDVQKAPLYV